MNDRETKAPLPRRSAVWKSAEAAFLAFLPEIQKALERGHTVLYVHRLLSDRLAIGYVQFSRYVKKYRELKSDERRVPPETTPSAPATPVSEAKDHQPKRVTPPSASKGFHFDPMDLDVNKLI